MLETGPLLEVGLPAIRFSLPGEIFWILRAGAGARAIGTEGGRCIEGIAMAVVILIDGGVNWMSR